MTFDTEQLEMLFRAKALGTTRGQVLMPWAEPMADELVERGWLAKHTHGDDSAYFWTPRAETALDLQELTTAHEGRDN